MSKLMECKRFTYLYPKAKMVIKGIGWSVALNPRQKWRIRERHKDLSRVVIQYTWFRIMLSEADMERYFNVSEWWI